LNKIKNIPNSEGVQYLMNGIDAAQECDATEAE